LLSESSYLTAIYTYVGSAAIMLVYLAWWLGRHWRPGWVALAVLLAAALLLTPAFPRGDVDTMAPALIVAGFQLLTDGYAAAEHALRPLVFMSAVAVVLAFILWLLFLRGRAPRKSRRAKAANTD
jgi:hypothetical protein